MLHVRLEVRRNHPHDWASVKQVWVAEDLEKDLYGEGRNRIAAIRDVKPNEERLKVLEHC